MGTADDMFRFLLKVATDVQTMNRLRSGDPALVELAFEGSDLSDTQKDAVKNGSEADIRYELQLPQGFVFNQNGFVPAPDPEKWPDEGARKPKKAKKAKKTSKAASKGKGPVKKSAKKASKASKKTVKKATKKAAKRAAKKGKRK
jgi:hypothetical protein